MTSTSGLGRPLMRLPAGAGATAAVAPDPLLPPPRADWAPTAGAVASRLIGAFLRGGGDGASSGSGDDEMTSGSSCDVGRWDDDDAFDAAADAAVGRFAPLPETIVKGGKRGLSGDAGRGGRGAAGRRREDEELGPAWA